MKRSKFKKSIQRVNLFRMIFPLLFLTALFVFTLKSPILNCLFPTDMNNSDNINELYDSGTRYVNYTANNLYYTGYDYLKGNTVKGHYYYSLDNDRCTIYLFASDYFEDGILPELKNIRFSAEFITNSNNLESLITYMAKDLNWDVNSLNNYTGNIIISQMDYAVIPSILISGLLLFMFAFSLGHIFVLFYNICFPQYAYTFVAFGHHNARRKLILSADSEFPDKTIFKKECMYVTAHYFIYISMFNIAVIPLNKMAWAYKYSRLHKFILFGPMTYTIKIVTKSKVYYRFRRKSKEAADELLECLFFKNPDMLIGYTQANRRTRRKELFRSVFSMLYRKE